MNRFIEALAKVCNEHLLEEKWLLAPTTRVGHQWLLQVSKSGQPVINAEIKTAKSLALALAGPEMAHRRVSLMSTRLAQLFVDVIIRRLQGSQLRYLGQLSPNIHTAQTIHASLEAIRLAGLTVHDIRPGQFEAPAKGADLQLILNEYLDQLQRDHLVDYADVLCMARERVRSDRSEFSRGPILLVPDGIGRAGLERDLFQAFPAHMIRTLAVDRPWSPGSSPPEVGVDRDLLRYLLLPGDAPEPAKDNSVEVFSAIGEANEVREVLRRCLDAGIAFDDVEILHTDSAIYVPLIYEILCTLDDANGQSPNEPPVTFAEGISCRYSRPGRAFAAWLAWIREGYPQASLVRMIREGLVLIPGGMEEEPSFTALAATLRSVPIGIGRDRYPKRIETQIKRVSEKLRLSESARDEDGEMSPGRHDHLNRQLAELETLGRLIGQLLDITPLPTTDHPSLLTAAGQFLNTFARRVDKVDNYAHERLVLDIQDMRRSLGLMSEPTSLDVWEWLFSLPAEAQILGSSPREGCLHVAPLLGGGHSGRGHTFVLGMDDGRFPGSAMQDPVLLDGERKLLSEDLTTAAVRQQESRVGFARLLAGLRGRVTFSFSCRDLVDDREMFPSPLLLNVYRIVSGKHDGDQSDFRRWLSAPASFAPRDAAHCLNEAEWWLANLCDEKPVRNATEVVASRYPHLARGLEASRLRESDEFTVFDGFVAQAGKALDPTKSDDDAPVMSSGQLELIGRCPLAFFFRHALQLEEPKELVIDPGRWLDAPALGLLVHEVLEEFVRELLPAARAPNYERDFPRLTAILQHKVADYLETYPPPNESAFQDQLNFLNQVAHIFLKEEESLCAQQACLPAHLEVSIGTKREGQVTAIDTEEPYAFELPSGKKIRIRGRVDRIDRIGTGAVATYRIWDYKTGGSYRYERDDPFRQGRVVQPVVYLAMVGHRLRQALAQEVEIAHFGFFFPNAKERGNRISWQRQVLADGAALLEQLCNIVGNGAFLATNQVDDCNFCSYRGICGNVEEVAKSSQLKLDNPRNAILQPVRALRPDEKTK
jgi:ATP-dependent helicase/nuclease subunit B